MMPFTVLKDSPRIVLFPDFVSSEEIETLLEVANKEWKESTVVDMQTGGPIATDYRTGFLSQIDREHDISKTLTKRISAVCDVRPEQNEGLQVIKYKTGNQYLPHTDWFDPRIPGIRKVIRFGGQRIRSIIICLTAAEMGGETDFPKIKVRVKLKPGEALIFEDVRPDGVPDINTTHAGMPVLKGEKIVIANWIRERKFDGSEEAPEGMMLASELKAIKRMREEACATELPGFLKHYGCYLRVINTPKLDKDGMVYIDSMVQVQSIPEKEEDRNG